MSNGFLATNNNDQILISSDTRNLHFVQKISSPTQVIYNTVNYGGINKLRYRVTCNITPVPFFTMPDSTAFYGTTQVTNVGGGLWDIYLIKSNGANSYPELYVFSDPRGATPTDSFGAVVYRDDGTPSFDSRLRPLAITGGLAVTHPSNPRPSFPYSLDPKYCASSEATTGAFFAPTEFNNYTVSTLPSKPMFFFPTLAQAEREAMYQANEEECDGISGGKLGCAGAYRYYQWNSYYWAFYRGAIRRTSSTQISAGWVTADFGCRWTYTKDSAFIGIGTGGASGSSGSWPYSNETINLSAATVIIGDASRYD